MCLLLQLGQIRHALQQLRQRLRRVRLIVRVHFAIRIRIVLPVQLRVRPLGRRLQLQELSAQTSHVFLATDHIL